MGEWTGILHSRGIQEWLKLVMLHLSKYIYDLDKIALNPLCVLGRNLEGNCKINKESTMNNQTNWKKVKINSKTILPQENK